MVTVEFYGIPRLRAGRASLAVAAGSIADVLEAVEKACPQLAGLVQANGRLAAQFLLSINGRTFLTETQQAVSPGDHVLLLSADAGG